MYTLHAEDVRSIHYVLVEDFAKSGDPLEPSGVRSDHLLESAVSRQHTGFGGTLKYATPYLNAATLCYGICCDHPFHNGNKRTALVATLAHLDGNDLMVEDGTSQTDLYNVMIRVASRGFSSSKRRDDSDSEVAAFSKWLRKRTRRIERGERTVTCRQLKTIIQGYGYVYENPHGNQVDLVKYTETRSWFGFSAPKQKRERIMRLPYQRDGAVVGRDVLKELRERCCLTEKHGVDSRMFYSERRTPDYFIARYHKTLKLLARI